MMQNAQVFGLFPVPLMHVEQLLPVALVEELVTHFAPVAHNANAKSAGLSHTQLFSPESHALASAAAGLIEPRLAEFGELLFGERLPWSIKEMWANVLQHGGQQAMHNHANCFISGVLYLTPSHASANTVFMKGPGGRDFAFSNNHRGSAMGPFNADKWIAPDAAPGDLLLFPSYLLHEVPANQGGQRISLAFNAIPSRLDSWGYSIGFSPGQEQHK
jgi:uncharacterized protein (TIGR02466 family)